MHEYQVLPGSQKGWGPGDAPAHVTVANTCAANAAHAVGKYETKVNHLPEQRHLPWEREDNWPTHGASFSVKNIGQVPLMVSW